MEILIIGAGVLGSLYASRLARVGHPVTVLARGTRADSLRNEGILLEAIPSGEQTATAVGVIETLDPEADFDLALVMVRKYQLADLLPMLAKNQKIPTYLFLGNNVVGAEEIVSVLDSRRVLLGFAAAGGVREGNRVRYLAPEPGKDLGKTILGALDGSRSVRLLKLRLLFEGTGLPVQISTDIDAWLKNHAAVILPVAWALYAAGGDNYRLARTRDGVLLMLRAVRENLKVLRLLGIPVLPWSLRWLAWLPEPLMLPWLQRMLDSRQAEIGLAGHANAARDEILLLSEEFARLTRAAAVPVPAGKRLMQSLDPDQPVLPEGVADETVDWNGLWMMVSLGIGLVALVRFLFKKLFWRREVR